MGSFHPLSVIYRIKSKTPPTVDEMKAEEKRAEPFFDVSTSGSSSSSCSPAYSFPVDPIAKLDHRRWFGHPSEVPVLAGWTTLRVCNLPFGTIFLCSGRKTCSQGFPSRAVILARSMFEKPHLLSMLHPNSIANCMITLQSKEDSVTRSLSLIQASSSGLLIQRDSFTWYLSRCRA